MNYHKLEVKNLYFSYQEGYEAIKNISFVIHKGESVALIGANGAGKSTLLMLLVGVLFADQGEIKVDDILVTKKTLPTIRQKLGMVFQDPDDQLFMTTVYDDVAFGPRNYGLGEQEVASRVQTALEMVGIAHLQDRAPFKLSGGEKRLAAMACILSMQPEVLLMDEPTSALDPKSRRTLINLLKDFRQTKIIASHDLDMVFEVCNRIIIIKEGKIVADDRAAHILSDKQLLDSCGLELPLALQNCPLCQAAKDYKKI
ncbi:MAG: energy-coupling factor ABC transporter ATP-binding protein [Bacillota bacterium]|jgi:cobalt/nickel transport system ATP-binding protein